MAKNKVKDPNRLPFSGYAGTTLSAATYSIVAALMTSYFMLYLTDYSGLGAFGATLGSGLLVFARVFDAVNDPVEGWIVNKAKPGKNGKYRRFLILSTVLMGIGVSALFFIPSAIVNSPVFVGIYVIVFYLLYDIGYAFFMQEPLFRTMTLNADERGKLLIGPRIMNMIMGIVISAMMSIITAVNQSIGNLHTSFGIVVTGLVFITVVISLIGIFMIKEKYQAPVEDDEKIQVKDFLLMFKENDAFRVKFLAGLASGFIYTLMYATANYYAKWAYCADLTTGVVDTGKYATFVLIVSMISFTPLILGTLLGTPIMKKFGTPDRAARCLTLIQCIPLGIIFILQIAGILQLSPVLYFSMMVITSLAMGASYIPVGVINMETMDYDVYKNDKDRAAIQFSASKLIEKAQQAFATAMVGIILTAVGYVVDSATDTYVGDLGKMPTLLNWFTVIMGLLPLLLGITSYLIMRHYPITPEIREQIRRKTQQ